MVLRIALVALLLAGCKESLFDERVNLEVDAGAGDIDAGDLATCPAPCLGDAAEDFADVQQGTKWRYRSVARDERGVDYADMTRGVPVEGVEGWVGTGSPAPGLGLCTGSSPAACAGLSGRLLVVPSAASGNVRDAVVQFNVTQSGRFRLSGSLRTADGAPAGPMERLLISRNTRNDVIHGEVFSPSTTPFAFDVEIEAVAGDRLVVELRPVSSGTATPLGLQLFVTGLTGFPGTCTHTLTFDATQGALFDPCANVAWTDSTPATVTAPSVSAEMGMARDITHDTFLVASAGDPIPKDADFTVQFWYRNQENTFNALREQVYCDMACGTNQGGLWLDSYELSFEDNVDLGFAFQDPEIDWCNGSLPPHSAWSQPVEFDDWHFIRIVRSIASESIEICVDGLRVALSEEITAAADFSGSEPPNLGRSCSWGAAAQTAMYDDFRAFTQALPCAPSP